MKSIVVIWFVIAMSTSMSAMAGDLAISEYEATKQSRITINYIRGVENGYSWSNVILAQRNQQMLYCPPSKKAFDVQELSPLIDQQLAFMRSTGALNAGNEKTIPISLVLYLAFARLYPCQ